MPVDELERSEDQADPLIGTIVADRYRVEARLGEGAMGAVYRAEHVHMQKQVALKVLHRETSANAEIVKRFEREAIAAGRVVHPNVATAQDFGQLADGSFYLVLEYVSGYSLRELLHREGALAVDRAVRIALQIAAALSAAHQAAVVHRDLKPENVMLVVDAQEGDFVKVLDFGLAKLGQEGSTDTKLTQMGAVYGTPQYMAPEQAAGTEVDARADLYALGVMLYEMLKGEPPFQADQMVALLVKHMTEAPPPLPREIPEELTLLVSSLLSKRAEDRPETAEQVLTELLQLQGGERSVLRTSLGSFPLLHPSLLETEAPRAQEKLAWRAQADHWKERAIALSRERVTWRGRTISKGVIGAGGALVVTGLLLGFAFGGSGEATADPASPLSSTAPQKASVVEPETSNTSVDPELLRVIQAAKDGSAPALYALEQRRDGDRSEDEWIALAQARLMRKNVEPALKAWSAAIEQNSSWIAEKTLLGAARQLADEEPWSRPILEFAAAHLGELGADFLFHVWAKTSLKTEATTLAHELLTSRAVEKKMSESLRVALELRNTEKCEDVKVLLPRVEQHGDDRSLVRLRELEKNRGCGAGARADCYPCLRGDSALRGAISQAAMRAGPRFELNRRFRFR